MKKTIISIITVILLLSLTVLTAFATGETTAADTTVRMNEFGKVTSRARAVHAKSNRAFGSRVFNGVAVN